MDDNLEDPEESWTFIGDDNDPELIRRMHDWDVMTQWQPRAPTITASSKNGSRGSSALGAKVLDKMIAPNSTAA